MRIARLLNLASFYVLMAVAWCVFVLMLILGGGMLATPGYRMRGVQFILMTALLAASTVKQDRTANPSC